MELGVGEVGQIGGKGASLMLGYYGDEAATASSFNSDGWFMTGDIGSLDEDGYLHIKSRIKDVIIRGGHNIYPARIEQLAARHPDVDKVAAVPFPDERLGEKVCLVVKPANGTKLLIRDKSSDTLKLRDCQNTTCPNTWSRSMTCP